MRVILGHHRVRGERSRGVGGKVLVLGILKRGGKVYTQIIPRATKKNIFPILRGKILDESIVYTDGWKSYDGLIQSGYNSPTLCVGEYHLRNDRLF